MLFWKCANVQAPDGGVKDTISPVIIYSYPTNNSLNFSDDKVKVKFSKYMNTNSVNDNIFIQPEVKAEYKWWAKNLTIKFLEDLKENTTYSIQFGTNYTDWKNNKPLYDYSIVFSTGEIIDSGRIKGTIFGDDLDGAYVYAFPLTEDDSLIARKPNYRAQLSDNGVFFINALKDGNYRIITIKDKFDNKIYDPEVDDFGAANNDVSPSDSLEIQFRIGDPTDRTSPILNSAFPINNRLLEISFSENLDLIKSKDLSFYLMDSLKRDSSLIKKYSLKDDSKKNFILLLPNDLIDNSKYILNVKSAIDSSGNEIQDSSSNSIFVTSPVKFDEIIDINGLNFKDSTNNFDPFNHPSLFFNSFINLNNKIKVFEDSLELEYELIDDGFMQTVVFNKKEETNYRLEIDLRNSNLIDSTFSKDSTVILNFKTSKFKEYSKLKGIFIDSSECNSSKIMLLKNSKDSIINQVDIEEGTWEIDSVLAGDYYIEVFCDENEDGVYSYGYDIPFKHSEHFQITNKAIKVKERWDVEDIEVIFK